MYATALALAMRPGTAAINYAPMNDKRIERILRQHVETDRLLGVDSVPVSQAVPVIADAAPGTPHVAAAEPLSPSPAAPALFVEPIPPAPALPSPPPVSPVSPVPPAKRLPREEKMRLLAEMDATEVHPCIKCILSKTRTNTVFGEGNPDAELMFIGEGPGETEDNTGRPFVGRAGEKLTEMIVNGMKLRREDVFIANIVKCRPPENRAPAPDEVDSCWDYLRRQILIIQPRVIVALGAPATKTLLQTTTGIMALRGTWQKLTRLGPGQPEIPVMPTFHPAYLLRYYTRETRMKVWSDLKQVLQFLAQK